MINILLATYNGEKYLSEQLDSIVNQTYKDWKLIIHDDGSSDGTIKVIEVYVAKYPEKIVFIDDNVKTGGAKNNFLHLMKFATEPYIMFCDQDDLWLQNKIQLTYDIMVKNELKYGDIPLLVHTDLKIVDSRLNLISSSMVSYQKLKPENGNNIVCLAIENCITGCTMMINKKLLNESLRMPQEAMMHDWWIGLMALKNKGIIKFLPMATILYRQHAINTIGAKEATFIYYIQKLLHLNSLLMGYYLISKQYQAAEIKINYFKFFITKLRFIFRKLI